MCPAPDWQDTRVTAARTRRQLPFRGDGRPETGADRPDSYIIQAPVGRPTGRRAAARRNGGWRVGGAEYRMSDASSASL